ncbi:coiled-coil domain-containing protein [Nocardiopsis sp. NPDC050513]|uniref:coiled-coil domain-containing protein n=1 Tax=Nocardiopsis sp. NPDC050513 TaxID=3364338 RepID=UPI0037B7AF90
MTRIPGSPSARPPRGARLVAAALCAAAVVVPQAAHADPEDLDIDELNARAEDLEQTYDGELLQFEEIEERAERAEEDLAEVEEELERSRSGVARIAAGQYMGTAFDPALDVVFSSEPEDFFTDVAMVEQLGRNQAGQISHLVALQEERTEIASEAEEELAEAQELIEDLEGQRDEVEALIEEYEAQQVPEAPATPATGSIPDSVRGWGFDGATPRMAAIRDEVILNVGVPYEVGCARNSNDDHGSGQACDFMVSVIGTHPSGGNRSVGNQIAQYAIDNVDRLGVKYVIWEQRIWHAQNRQWVAMNDRGSVTENHYDHVHISSY